jgi:hypothetical protein
MKELNKTEMFFIVVTILLITIVLDFIDVTKYFCKEFEIDSIISNIITFESIIIGFISTIYVMIQSFPNSNIKKLLLEFDRLGDFNKCFEKVFIAGVLNIILLIGLQFILLFNNFGSKIYTVIVILITSILLLSANNLIAIMMSIINYEEIKEKEINNKMQDSDLLNK